MTQRALIILHPGFEETEAVTPIDLLHRAEIEVVLASTADTLDVDSRCGLKVKAHARLEEVADADYDLVFLPGGPGIQNIRRHPTVCAVLRKQAAAARWIGCICAAPLLLLDAGLSDGIEIACHPSAESELARVRRDPVVVSGKIVTSRGAGTATQFGLALVARLKSADTAREVADAICWPHPL
ncbi:MAG: DJ-1 family glyoxalase III [Opitutales bacterium]